MSGNSESLENLSTENRTFPPSSAFSEQANASSDLYARADKDRLAFWDEQASTLNWHKKWDKTLKWESPFAQWFVGGKINATVNAVDRHVAEGNGHRIAFHFEGEPGDTRTISYAQLLADVSKAANALTEIGIGSEDRVAIYMPLIPEAIVAMLACARIGAIHSVVFGGFAAKELATRIDDAKPKLVLTTSCGIEPGRVVAYKPLLDEAIRLSTSKPENVILFAREQAKAEMIAGRDHDWTSLVEAAKKALEMAQTSQKVADDALVAPSSRISFQSLTLSENAPVRR
jgi:acetyl-CoA synthetase